MWLPKAGCGKQEYQMKTCLHSVSYAGVWRGQARLSVDEFLDKAKQFGFDGVMLMAKRRRSTA